MLTSYQQKSTHIAKILNKHLQEGEKIILPRHDCIKTDSEDCRKLEVLSL
jgi:hypothetical protein